MTILDKITAMMEQSELKKFKLQKSILTLMLEWKHLEEYMDSTQSSFQQCFEELKRKEDHLNSVQESAMESNKELESIRVSVEERMKQMDKKEKAVKEFYDKVIKQDEWREEKAKVTFEKFIVEEERIEKMQDLIEESMEKQVEELRKKEMEFNVFKDQRVKELDLRYKELEERIKKVELREEKVMVVFEGLKVKAKTFEDIREELRKKEIEFNVFKDDRVNELDLGYKELEERTKKVELREQKVKVVFDEFKVKEKTFEDIKQSVGERIDWIEKQVKELNEKEKEFERRVKELDAKEKDFYRRIKKDNAESVEQRRNKPVRDQVTEVRDIESMRKENYNVDPTNAKIKLERADNALNSSIVIQFIIRMNGKGLMSALNLNEKGHHLMTEEVYRGLQLSSDPAKLVLDAMDGFYCQPNIRNSGFKLKVVRKSCLLLLMQLQRVLPQVSPQVEARAMELASQWKAKMKKVPEFMEVLGNLYLLASYRLPVPYDANELLGLFEIVAEHRQAPELCRLLGFTGSVPDLIRNLVRKNQILAAVRFISEFGLLNEFSPALLLKDYVKQLEMISKKMLRSNKSPTNKNADIDNRVAALREVITCILDHKLESLYSPQSIEQSIEHLLREKGDNKVNANPPSKKPVEHEKSRMESMSTILSNPPSTSPSSSMPVAPELVPVSDMAFILSNMNGERLQCFLNMHFEDHKLIANEVLLALQHSSDPTRIVLDAIQGFHRPYKKVGNEHFGGNVIRGSCILLLEQLMRLQGQQHQLNSEIIKIAHQWELKLEDNNPQMILGFLQFIVAFRLTSHFGNNELLDLFEKIKPHPHAQELCQILGFSEKNPGCVLHSHLVSEKSSSEIISLNKAVDLVNVGTEGNNEVSIFHNVSDPAKLVLDVIQGCYYSILKKGTNCPKMKIMDTVSSLLEQLRESSPHIKPQVHEEAKAFSIDWKSKLVPCRKTEAEVKALLNFLATYRVGSSVMFEVLCGLLETVHEYENKFKLYRHLNFTHLTPDYIQYLIENDERLLAIKFIYEFKLVDKFPPDPILKSHLRSIQELCKKIREEGDHSPQAMDKAANKEVTLLRSMIRFLKKNRIECECKPENLQVIVDQILKQKEDLKVMLPCSNSIVGDMKKRNFEGQPKETRKRLRLSKEGTNYRSLPHGQGRLPVAWEFGYGGSMAPLGWQQNIPNVAGNYYRGPTNVIPVLSAPMPYLYHPWHQP